MVRAPILTAWPATATTSSFAALMALRLGDKSTAVANAVGGVTTAMSAIFILLAVGALIGT